MNHDHDEQNSDNQFCPCHGHSHSGSIIEELMAHLPYSIFAVALCLIILSFVGYLTLGSFNPHATHIGAGNLFHVFHFIHLVFAATGSLITFFRFSSRVGQGLLVGVTSAMLFCTLSDAVIPYFAGRLLGVAMSFHICFISELRNILPFLAMGLVNGLIVGKYNKHAGLSHSFFFHFSHILVSSFASTFYLVAHGLVDWYSKLGMVFIFLIIAVIVPCIMGDVAFPMLFSRLGKKYERN